MSLENDPFDTQPAPLPTQPSPELEPQPLEQYADISAPPQPEGPRVPIAVWIGLGILGIALCIAVILLLILLTQGGGGGPAQPTLTPTPVQPTVAAIPDVTSGGTLVTLQGSHLRPNDLMVFYLRDPAKPTDPILKIGSVQTDPAGRFAWSFTYPADPRWALIPNASVIVQSTATGGYLTVPLQVVPTGIVATGTVPVGVLPTWTPIPTGIIPTPTSPPVIYPTLTQTPDPNAWRGEYFNNPNLQGSPIMVRNDPSVNFGWNYASPAANIPADYFSARWTRTLNFEAGMYRFSARVDDGIRVWLDSSLIIDEWHTATPNTYLKDVNVPAGQHVLRVEYLEGVGTAFINFNVEKITSYPDWKGDYFNNQFLSGSPSYTRNDAAVAFDWNSVAPVPGVPNQNFSVRWTRTVEFAPGNYRFTIRVNGGANLLIDGNLVIGQWNNNVNGTFTADYTLGPGTHTFEIDYYNLTGPASIWFTYQPLTGGTADWSGNYFANDRWSGLPTLVRFDPNIDFDWSTSSPGPLLPVDRFSARWTRVISLTAAGLYRIDVTVDDGVRVYVDNNVILDQVKESSAVNYTTQVQLTQGHHEIRVEYVEYSGQAVMKFNLASVSVFATPTPAPPTSTFTPTPSVPPTSTFTPTPPPTPVINTFTASPATVVANGQDCVTLIWSTTGARSTIEVRVNGQNGQTILSGDPAQYATSTATHCPTEPGTKVYTLIITASSDYGMVTATQTVEAVAPPTPTSNP
ncbi:beta-glucosidase [Thermoflexales bacterium]|nr:beta-glucosidase [Thermoflexales bacterium]